MPHSAKYIIHADVRTSGVVERSDVVGAIFGQTEGLLGEDMDLRDLQDASKVGRIDVDIDSEGGRSFGTIQIASGMDRAETAVLAAALETIERVGPCRANCSILKIEDARAAKRREIVDRATELLAAFEDEQLTSERLVEEVRERVRESEIGEYHGLPAGPRVADSDAIIVVEGRADVRKLLSVGIKNAVAVEGTDVPEEIARLTRERTTTAFLDGDRGGDLILRELAQVGSIDYVAFAPRDESVEDLDRGAIMAALRKKVPYEQVAEETTAREAFAPTDGGTVTETAEPQSDRDGQQPPTDTAVVAPEDPGGTTETPETTDEAVAEAADDTSGTQEPTTLGDHIEAVIEADTGTVRLLDGEFALLAETDAETAFETIEDAEEVPHTVVLDDVVTQRLLDVSAQRGVGRIIGAETGEFVKQPASVRVHAADDIEY
jgi:DNA primase